MNDQAIIKLIESLGAQGKDAFVWWVWAAYVIDPIIRFLGVGFLIWCLRSLVHWVTKKVKED